MSRCLRLVFAGTPEFAVPALDAVLASDHELLAVYTQPDRPSGRGRQRSASPVKQRAIAAGVPVRQPETLRGREVQAELAALQPELMIVIAYGLILPRRALAIPTYGCWNLHASLLPRWRGAAPIQRAILAGDPETGVCLMQMEAGLDTGPVLLQARIPIGADDSSARLHDRLAVLAAEVLADGLHRLSEDRLPAAQVQDVEGVSHAAKLDKTEAQVEWSAEAAALERSVRAFNPWPGATADLDGEPVRLWRANVLPAQAGTRPGQVVAAGRDGIDVACGNGVLRIVELQRPGGRRITAADYLNSRPKLRVEPA